MASCKTLAFPFAVLALGAMTSAPLMAVPLPATGAPPTLAASIEPLAGSFDPLADKAERHRRYRHWHRRHHHVDAGDVLAGVLIIGGIAAIANAAAKADERADYPAPPPRWRGVVRGGANAYEIERAVRSCTREVERDVRIEEIDGVEREGDGWRVRGRLFNGEGFSCRVSEDGEIEDIDWRDSSFADGAGQWSGGELEGNPGQWSDEEYARARAMRASQWRSAGDDAAGGGAFIGDRDDRYDMAGAGY